MTPHPTICACGGQSRVNDSRGNKRTVTRRRVCLECGERWTTNEVRTAELEQMQRENAAIRKVRAVLR